LEACQVVPSRAGDLYDSHIHQLQKDIEKVVSEKTQVEIELENCIRELNDLRKRYIWLLCINKILNDFIAS